MISRKVVNVLRAEKEMMVKWSKNCYFVPDFTILPSSAAVLCHQTMCNPWGFSCMTPINFNQSQENKLLSEALWKCTPPFLTIILLCFVWWGIFRRQSWILHHFNTHSLFIMKSALFAACSLLRLTTDFTTQMTKWLTSAFLYMT